MRRVVLVVAALIAATFLSVAQGDAATISKAWMARYGTLGTVTVRQFTTLNGTLVVNLYNLHAGSSYGVALYRTSCTGALVYRTSLLANSYGKISRTLGLSAAQERAFASHPAVKVGSTCRVLPQTFSAISPSPTPTPTPRPTPTPAPTGVYGNPWGYNFTPGNLIYNPPSAFCSYFNCIPSFWQSTNGYVVECVDTMFSHSGGRSGACSYHGGEWRALYSH
jgi:hypothetical protein